MTVAQMLLDMKAAHAAREEASMANRVRRMGVEEAE